jgi:hypothetical protein
VCWWRDYALEDKAPFLLEADRLGLPVAPFVKAPRVFVKHRSIEGGQVGACALEVVGFCMLIVWRFICMHARVFFMRAVVRASRTPLTSPSPSCLCQPTGHPCF